MPARPSAVARALHGADEARASPSGQAGGAGAAVRAASASLLGLGAALSAAGPALAAEAVARAAAEVGAPGSVDPSQYVFEPVEVGWQIWFGAAIGVFPFLIGASGECGTGATRRNRGGPRGEARGGPDPPPATPAPPPRAAEFGKRILIQRRCQECKGCGLVPRPARDGSGEMQLRKCPECGGFFPWQSWRQFFSETARPGNGGPLLQPRGQTSVLYKVPDAPDASRPDETMSELVDRLQGAPGGEETGPRE